MSHEKNKTKLYLAVTLIMIIIIVAWILNLKNYFNQDETKQAEPNQELSEILNDFSDLLVNVKNIKDEFAQSATTTGADLQGGPQISPDQLDQIAERLKLETSTSTATSTPTTTVDE